MKATRSKITDEEAMNTALASALYSTALRTTVHNVNAIIPAISGIAMIWCKAHEMDITDAIDILTEARLELIKNPERAEDLFGRVKDEES